MRPANRKRRRVAVVAAAAAVVAAAVQVQTTPVAVELFDQSYEWMTSAVDIFDPSSDDLSKGHDLSCHLIKQPGTKRSACTNIDRKKRKMFL
jgi:hypothetical protein